MRIAVAPLPGSPSILDGMEPVQNVLGLRGEIPLKLTHGVFPLGEERDVLVVLHSLGASHLKPH